MPDAEFTMDLDFDEGAEFDMGFQEAEMFDMEMQEIIRVVTSDHRELLHRDAQKQHPIEAIDNLMPELEQRPSQALSNQDIQDILNS